MVCIHLPAQIVLIIPTECVWTPAWINEYESKIFKS